MPIIRMVVFSHLGVCSLKKKLVTVFPVLLVAATCAAVAFSQAPAATTVPTKVATIQVQAAILSTNDGKKAHGVFEGV